MKSLKNSPDPTYTSVNLSVFAIAEVFVGAFTASLPPLRKTFENLLHKILPASLTGVSKTTENRYALKGVGSQLSTKPAKPKHECDDDSERSIFPADQISIGKGSDHAITKTTQVSVTADSFSVVSKNQQDDWV